MSIAHRTAPLVVFALAAAIGLVAVAAPLAAIAAALAVMLGVLMLVDFRIGFVVFAGSTVLLDGVGALGISADKLVIGTLVMSWLASLAIRPDVRERVTSAAPMMLVLTGLYGLWCAATIVWAVDPGEAQYQLVRLYPNLLLVPVALSAIEDGRTVRWAGAALLAAVLFSAAYGLVIGGLGDALNEGRLAGSDLDSNSLAVWLIMGSTLTMATAISTRDPLIRLLAVAAIAVAGLAVLATGSRTGLLSLGAVLLAAPVVLGRGRRLAAIAVLALALLGTGVYVTTFADAAVRERLTSGDTDGGSGRTSLWAVTQRMIEANPIGGVGGGNFPVASVRYLLEPGQIQETKYIVDKPEGVHNTYLQIAAETGLVGALLFIGLFGLSFSYTLRAARWFSRIGDERSSVLARAIALAFIGVAVGCALIGFDTSEPLWLLIALGPVMYKLAKRQGLGVAT